MISSTYLTSQTCYAMMTPPVDLTLDQIRAARGDINEIRLLLQGSKEECLRLFREAVKADDVIAQIQLAFAYFGMRWGEDGKRNFSSLVARDLEEFDYYFRGIDFFNAAYDEAMEVKFDSELHAVRGKETFSRAADLGDLSARLVLLRDEWRMHADSYGFAVQLRPFVGKGDKKLDYCFGRALKNGCCIGSEPYYEGLYWMQQSLGIPVKYPRTGQSFKDFSNAYDELELSGSYSYDGFTHLCSGVVLAPSKASWERFIKEKLTHVHIAKPESYLFKHDPKEIKSLIKKYKISACHTESFRVDSALARDNADSEGTTIHGFRLDKLSIFEDDVNIGEIAVREDTFEIYKTLTHPKIQPVITFIENVMKRSGSAHSAYSWLRQMEKD